jgi:uracil phosphoribosyltransferase
MASRVELIRHPIIEHKLGILRDRRSTPHDFRQVFSELSGLLAYESTRDLKLRSVEIETPLEKTQASVIAEELVIACILRAGEGMLEGFLRMLPFARVGHIGIYRDKALNNTVEYYFKLPHDVRGKRVLLLDPLLATGDTALAALDRLKQYDVGAIRLVTLLSARVGLEKIHAAHPDVDIYTLSIERELNDKGYLLPGLGDAGDRLFGTA